ncbi:MAG: exodeoxyribonuclease VII small subunit [Saprospiraceae bacterium]
MNKELEPLNYAAAYAELQMIVHELQDESADLDALTARIARASELIRFCRERLRLTEEEVAKLTAT